MSTKIRNVSFEAGLACRICMKNGNDSVPILEHVDYYHQFKYCTNIEIDQFDGLPSVICTKCVGELQVAYNFIVKCKQSDEKFKEILNRSVKEEPFDHYEPPLSVTLYEYPENDDDDTKTTSPVDRKSSKKQKIKGHKLGKKKLQCGVCGLICQFPSTLKIHSRTHTGEKPFKCDQCDRSFTLKTTMVKHVERFHTDYKRTFTCNVCGKQFYRMKDIVVHMRIHTGELPYACTFCAKRFRQHATLIRHVRTHTGEKPYTCDTCGKSFAGYSNLKKHSFIHTEERRHKCHICGKAVKSKETLNKHILAHANGPQYICDLCGQPRATKLSMRRHIATIHSSDSGHCAICNKHCARLENHMMRHTGEAPFECDVCSRRFNSQRSLSRHALSHTKAANHHCVVENCGKKFQWKCALDFHIQKDHMNKAPHACDECDQSYYRKSDLSRHMNVYHHDKNFALV